MISAGNDIVALGSINKQRTCEPRFYSKILSATEQELYHQPEFASLPFENYVWLLWSIKESAFKYLKRNSHELVFSPVKMVVSDIEILSNQQYWGSVQYNSAVLFFQSTITNDWISTIVNDNECFDQVINGVQTIEHDSYNHQSASVREVTLNRLNDFFEGDLKLEKTEWGYPVLIKDQEPINIPVSLAHHGHYVSYSFNLNPVML